MSNSKDKGGLGNNVDPDKPYKVGNKKPPLHTRFQKGKSGNPNRRDSTDTNVANALQDVQTDLESAHAGGMAWVRPSQPRVGAARPSAGHCPDQRGGSSISRLRPKPRGRHPSIAAATSAGSRKASESVCRMDRSVRRSRIAIEAIEASGSAIRRSSQSRALR
jgi:hypothetical protein